MLILYSFLKYLGINITLYSLFLLFFFRSIPLSFPFSFLFSESPPKKQVANQELKGLMCYFNLGLKDVFVPLMTLVDYRGFRLVAMSVLPVKKNSLIYGYFFLLCYFVEFKMEFFVSFSIFLFFFWRRRSWFCGFLQLFFNIFKIDLFQFLF